MKIIKSKVLKELHFSEHFLNFEVQIEFYNSKCEFHEFFSLFAHVGPNTDY